MAGKTLAQKVRVKPGVDVAVLNEDPGLVGTLGLPPDTRFVAPDAAQLLFLFVQTRTELDGLFPEAVASLADGAALWVFFRKGSTAAGFDVNRDSIWVLGESLGLRPLGVNSVNDAWSVFRLRGA